MEGMLGEIEGSIQRATGHNHEFPFITPSPGEPPNFLRILRALCVLCVEIVVLSNPCQF